MGRSTKRCKAIHVAWGNAKTGNCVNTCRGQSHRNWKMIVQNSFKRNAQSQAFHIPADRISVSWRVHPAETLTPIAPAKPTLDPEPGQVKKRRLLRMYARNELRSPGIEVLKDHLQKHQEHQSTRATHLQELKGPPMSSASIRLLSSMR